MKKRTFVCAFVFFFFLSFNLRAQNFWLPDSGFRACLRQFFPALLTTQDSLKISVANNWNTYINLTGCGLKDLNGIQYFTHLNALYCSFNSLTSVPLLSNSITILALNNNQISSISAFPTSLQKLDCGTNQLSSLPLLPNTLTYLNCDGNLLTQLPALPNSLVNLSCNGNPIDSIAAFPTWPALKPNRCRSPPWFLRRRWRSWRRARR